MPRSPGSWKDLFQRKPSPSLYKLSAAFGGGEHVVRERRKGVEALVHQRQEARELLAWKLDRGHIGLHSLILEGVIALGREVMASEVD